MTEQEEFVLKFRRLILAFLVTALVVGSLTAALTLTACRKPAANAPAVLTEAAPAAVAATEAAAADTLAAETTAAPTEPTAAVPTEPVKTGFPEPAGDMYTNIYLNRKGAPRIDWDVIPAAEYYEIYHSLYPDYNFELRSTTEEKHYTNSSAAKGLTHYYQIRALDDSGNIVSTSAVLSVETKLTSWESKYVRYVAVPKVKLHVLPDSASEEISLRYMDELKLGQAIIKRDTGTWYRVFYNDTLYYLLMKPDAQDLTSVKSPFVYNPQTTLQKQVLDLAMDICQNWNTTYVPGGTGDVNANGAYQFDCSGLVSYILNNAIQQTIPTYRLSSSMTRLSETDCVYNEGLPGEFHAQDVALEDIRPGDVLFFRSQLDLVPSEDLGHCSIYLGNNEFIHCTSVWEDSVCIMPLVGDFRDNLLAARRFLPDSATPAEVVKVIDGPYRNYKIYAEKNSDSAVVATPSQGDALTVLYTNNDNWAYVRTMSNLYGWFLLQHFGDTPAAAAETLPASP